MQIKEISDIIIWKITTPFRRTFFSLKYLGYKKNRFRFHDNEETVRKIVKEGYSLCRFGDGELRWAYGVRNNSFQINDASMEIELRTILESKPNDKIVVAIDELLNNTDGVVDSTKAFWREFCVKYDELIISKIPTSRIYGRTHISRPYIDYLDKTEENCQKRFDLLKTIWAGRDVVFVEGEFTRLGVGNDLFDNAKSIKRIICPAQNAYSRKNEIKSAIRECGTEMLYILALGPTATVVAYEMAEEGYQCIDVGHIDVEYMWYLQKAQHKIPVSGKFVQEAGGAPEDLTLNNRKYEDEIIKRVM